MTTASAEAGVRLRLFRPTDADALVAGYARLSETSRYLRFFSGSPRLTHTVLAYLTAVDGVDHVAIAAVDPTRASDVGSDEGLGVGIARYVRRPDQPALADVAVTVIDEYQGRGVGSSLFRTLAAYAYEQGIRELRADVLADNRAVLHLVRGVGGLLRPDAGGSSYLEAVIPLAPDPGVVAAVA